MNFRLFFYDVWCGWLDTWQIVKEEWRDMRSRYGKE